jgi:hypothetical protein
LTDTNKAFGLRANRLQINGEEITMFKMILCLIITCLCATGCSTVDLHKKHSGEKKELRIQHRAELKPIKQKQQQETKELRKKHNLETEELKVNQRAEISPLIQKQKNETKKLAGEQSVEFGLHVVKKVNAFKTLVK